MEKFVPLKNGSTIGICAPCARFDKNKLNEGIDVLKSFGFKIEIPKNIFEQKRYLAGEDTLRASVLNQLYSNPEIDCIISARGGFGAMRILQYLDWELIKNNPKPFVGYSDNTAILLSILENTGVPVIHGPNVVSLCNANQSTLDSFFNILTKPVQSINLSCKTILSPGKCKGILKGGNVATLSHLIGTDFVPDFTDCILFLEDIGEPAYKIDRMLTQMKMAGLFNTLAGVVIGAFEQCENDHYIDEILYEIFDDCHIPVLRGLDCGHGKVNLSLPMGFPVEMNSETLTLEWD